MNPKIFLKEFGSVANAPGGVQRLREIILQLAVMGKLVEQNLDDEPASEDLQNLKNEKEQLIIDGNFKKSQKSFYKVSTPFKIPHNWIWTRLNDIAAIARGGSPRPIKSFLTTESNGINWIKIGDSERGSIFIDSTKEKIIPEGLKKSRMVFPGDLILSNSMSFGYPYILNIQGCIHDGWLVVKLPKKIISQMYIYYLLMSDYAKNAFRKSAAGAVVQNLNAEKVRELSIPLPPFNEQKRIVAKVDKLMALCDRLEAQQQQRSKLVKNTRISALEALANAPGGYALKTAWKRVEKNLPMLFEAPDDVEDLKKCILQNAVMGKLVEQNPDDELASECLQNLKNEKEKLIIDGNFKKSKKALYKISTPFKIPHNWIWTRLNDIAAIARGGSPRPIKSFLTTDSNGINWIKIGDSERGSIFIDSTKEKIIPEGLKKSRMVFPGDLILSNSMSFGYPYILNIQGCIHDGWLVVKLPKKIISQMYIYYLLMSDYAKNAFRKSVAGAVVQNLNAEKVRELSIPLPPFNEQKRIVAKVDQLKALCETLQTELKTSKKIAEQFAKSVVENITGLSTEKPEKMKAPKTELITKLKLVKKPGTKAHAPLSAILAKNGDELSAKALWNHSGLPIDGFYRQLKIEMMNNWIKEPRKADVYIVEEPGLTT